jgi:hypothetical protein
MNPFSARTWQGRVQNDVAKMRVPGHAGYGEFQQYPRTLSPSILIQQNY